MQNMFQFLNVLCFVLLNHMIISWINYIKGWIWKGLYLLLNSIPFTYSNPFSYIYVFFTWMILLSLCCIVFQRINQICDDVNRILISTIKLSAKHHHMVMDWLAQCIAANRGIWPYTQCNKFHPLCHTVALFDTWEDQL